MTLTIDQAVPRFQTNETRFDTFVNGGVSATWTTSGGSVQPSITKFLADRASYVDGLAASTLSASTAAKNAAEAARDEAVEAADTVMSVAESVVSGRFVRTIFKATAGQTTKAVTYDVGFVDVYVNGFRLVNGDDFTATNGTSIAFTTPLSLNDDVEIVAFGSFMLPNALLKSANLSDIASGSAALTNLGFSALGKTLSAVANSAEGRSALGLGDAATKGFLDESDFASDSPSAAPSQKSVKAYIATLPFRKAFVSAEQSIVAGGAVTLAHGLGVKPALVSYVLVCKTAEAGYSIGDEIEMAWNGAPSGQNSYNLSALTDATNIVTVCGSAGLNILHKSTGGGVVPTNANWRFKVRAYA